jgi:hypothetical protein
MKKIGPLSFLHLLSLLMFSLFMLSGRSLAWSRQSQWLDQKSERASCLRRVAFLLGSASKIARSGGKGILFEGKGDLKA